MMLHSWDGAMLQRLLGLLVLSSLCSAMLHPDTTDFPDGEPPEMEPDWNPKTGGIPPPWNPDTNMTDPSQQRMLVGGNSEMPFMPDTSICDMLMDHPINQIPAFCLCSHCKGTMGPKGDRGDQGPPGLPGSPGGRGRMGFPGRPGYTGAQGIKGQKGDMGDKGSPGPAGFTGTKGSRGFKGDKGDTGMEGPQGTQGPQGETGTCPTSCETVQGPEGPQGVPGPAGGRGLPGVKGSAGQKGAMGSKGDMGTHGDPGVNGLKGDQGEQGICECTDGMDGSDGSPGESGVKGEKGDTGADGVQGPMGSKGSEGMIGLMGPPGPCTPTIRSAFSAQLNQSYPEHNKPIPFPFVIYNQMGHFNPIRGIYTAPVNGTYVFSYHLAVNKRTLKVALFHNRYPMVINTEGNQESTTSNSVVLLLARGDGVWLQVKDGTTNGMYTDTESRSTFSGYLLYPDSCDWPMLRNVWDQESTDEVTENDWNGPKDPEP